MLEKIELQERIPLPLFEGADNSTLFEPIFDAIATIETAIPVIMSNP